MSLPCCLPHLLTSACRTTRKLPTLPGYVGYLENKPDLRREGPESTLLTDLRHKPSDANDRNSAVQQGHADP